MSLGGNYSYTIEDNSVNLDDYSFNEYTFEETSIVKPQPTELTHSTRTVTLALAYPVKYSYYTDILDKNIIEYNTILNKEQLKYIIDYRVIKDGIPLLDYFKVLHEKVKKGIEITMELLGKILHNKTDSNFIDIMKIYDNTILSPTHINTMVIRDLPIKTVVDYTTTKRGFRNQITFRIISNDNTRNINIMVFQNGKLTITGCRSKIEVQSIIDMVINHIYDLINRGIEVLQRPEWNIEEHKLLLHVEDLVCHSMNYHFNLNFSIDNSELHTILTELNEASDNKLFYYIDFDPERFAGLKFRFNEDTEHGYKGSLCIVFQTGSINIYRSSSEEEIDYVYTTINKWMDTYYNQVKAF